MCDLLSATPYGFRVYLLHERNKPSSKKTPVVCCVYERTVVSPPPGQSVAPEELENNDPHLDLKRLHHMRTKEIEIASHLSL